MAVSARALAGLTDLAGWAEPFVARGAVAVFHKGQDFASELAEATLSWDLDLIEHQSKTEPTGPLGRGSQDLVTEILLTERPFMAQLAKSPRVLALANQKGGVGKTTTAINLGTALAAIGEEVLIVDLDPQGNASTGLGIDRRARKRSTYDVLVGDSPLDQVLIETAVPRLWVAPSTLDLLGVELEIAATADRAFRLRKAIAEYVETLREGRPHFTYVLVRLSAVAEPFDHQCDERLAFGAGAAAVRILRAGGPVAAAVDSRAGAGGRSIPS